MRKDPHTWYEPHEHVPAVRPFVLCRTDYLRAVMQKLLVRRDMLAVNALDPGAEVDHCALRHAERLAAAIGTELALRGILSGAAGEACDDGE